MKLYFLLIALFASFAFVGFISAPQENSYSVVGNWRLIDMQLDGAQAGPSHKNMKQNLRESNTRFVFSPSGKFVMVLGPNGRGLKGGYLYTPENHVLSIRYGAYTDTAYVSWDGANRMIHASKDGKTKTTLERVPEK